MASAQKKVVARLFSGALLWGYLPQRSFLRGIGIDLMSTDGRTSSLNINEIKTISYVRDFNLDDTIDPERIGRKSFLTRPRGDGLWLKLTYRDEDVLEGLAAFDIAFADSLLEDRGIFLSPPDARANTQRIFVPRVALRSLEVLGYVTSPSKRLGAKPAARVMADTQTKLFGE